MYIKMCLLLLLFPHFSFCQSRSGWELHINNKIVVSANKDSMPTVQVSTSDTASLHFTFKAIDTVFIRRMVVMDKQHVGVADTIIIANQARFSIQKLYRESNGKDLTFYIAKLPANPAQAALVRVAPYPICNLRWIRKTLP